MGQAEMAEDRFGLPKRARHDEATALTGLQSATTRSHAAETRDERFEFGLGCALDGIATRLPS